MDQLKEKIENLEREVRAITDRL